MKRRAVAGWSIFGAACTTACAVVWTARATPAPKSLSNDERMHVFSVLAMEENSMRRQAAKDWATDPWSQDDAFHNLEHQRASGLATGAHTSEQEVLRALDDGMREGWPQWGGSLKTTVPPCRP